MASSKQEETAATAEQFSSMSLGESAERKDNDTEPDAGNGTTPTKKCSACGGKGSNTLKKCRNCMCVWYCDKKCQNKHWKEHKKECRLIKKVLEERGGKLNLGTEVDIGPLEKLPQREECPICMRLLPLNAELQISSECCGKTLCRACGFQHQRKSSELPTCPFCRDPTPKSDEGILVLLRNRAEENDPGALRNIAMAYGFGEYGLPVDQAKCIALLRQSADLGHPGAQFNLGAFHYEGGMGLERNREKGHQYYKEAAEGGHVVARHYLGFAIAMNANGDGVGVAAMRHWRLAASGGYKKSMKTLIRCFEDGFLYHGDLAETLQAMYLARAEMKSEDRDKYIAHLKRTGKYKEEYDA